MKRPLVQIQRLLNSFLIILKILAKMKPWMWVLFFIKLTLDQSLEGVVQFAMMNYVQQLSFFLFLRFQKKSLRTIWKFGNLKKIWMLVQGKNGLRFRMGKVFWPLHSWYNLCLRKQEVGLDSPTFFFTIAVNHPCSQSSIQSNYLI